MDEFHPLNDSVSAVAAVSVLNGGNAVREVQKSAQSGASDGESTGAGPDARQSGAGAKLAKGAVNHLSSAGEFARAHQRISELLSDLRGSKDTTSVASAEEQVNALIPVPTVVVPMPPASEEMIERAVAIAEQIRADALLSRGAQAHVRAETAEAVLAA